MQGNPAEFVMLHEHWLKVLWRLGRPNWSINCSISKRTLNHRYAAQVLGYEYSHLIWDMEERDLSSFGSSTYPYIENQNMVIWSLLIISDSFWEVWYFSHFSSIATKYPSAIHAEKPVPKQWDWCDSVRDMKSCSPLWESCLHEGYRLSGFSQWNGSSAAQDTWAVALVFNMSDHDLLFQLVLGLENTFKIKIQEADWEISEYAI